MTDPAELRAAAHALLEENWQAGPDGGGYTAPNRQRYPFQWLWDSCFTAIAWAAVGEAERAVVDLAAVFAHQTPAGFVPHMGYQLDPGFHASFWGRPGASTLTQPPVYGHTIAELRRRGVTVPDELEERARRGLAWLFARRVREDGLVIVHPWESGCDDSPVFDAWAARPWTRGSWLARKLELAASLVLDPEGAAVANPRFETTHLGFTAIAAWSADELGMDRPSFGIARPAAPVALSDLLGCLVDPDLDALELAVDRRAYGGPVGPASVHRAHPSFRPGWYWRGSVFPPLGYLLHRAARRDHPAVAAALGDELVAGVLASGFAEHWHADTGRRVGSPRHSWAALAAALG